MKNYAPEEIRVFFEEAVRTATTVNFPLGDIKINGKFSHYADSDTDSAWLGYRAGFLKAMWVAQDEENNK